MGADSAALSKDGTGNRTAVQEKVQKLRGAVQEQVKQYFADPKHEQQLDAIRDEVKALVAKHIPDVKAWVAEHKADALAYLKKVMGDVEAGKIPPAYDCDITETACMEQMGITQPDAQAYMGVWRGGRGEHEEVRGSARRVRQGASTADPQGARRGDEDGQDRRVPPP